MGDFFDLVTEKVQSFCENSSYCRLLKSLAVITLVVCAVLFVWFWIDGTVSFSETECYDVGRKIPAALRFAGRRLDGTVQELVNRLIYLGEKIANT